MSQWVTLTLRCDDECGREFPGRVGERLIAIRARAADEGWAATGKDLDHCPVHAAGAMQWPRLAVVR